MRTTSRPTCSRTTLIAYFGTSLASATRSCNRREVRAPFDPRVPEARRLVPTRCPQGALRGNGAHHVRACYPSLEGQRWHGDRADACVRPPEEPPMSRRSSSMRRRMSLLAAGRSATSPRSRLARPTRASNADRDASSRDFLRHPGVCVDLTSHCSATHT